MPTPYWRKRAEGNDTLLSVYQEVQAVAATWHTLELIQSGRPTRAVLAHLERAGSRHEFLTDARAWRLTIDRLLRHVDDEVGVRHIGKACFAWLLYDTPYRTLSAKLRHPSVKRDGTFGDLLDRALIAFWSHLVERRISDRYRDSDLDAA